MTEEPQALAAESENRTETRTKAGFVEVIGDPNAGK